MPAVSVIITTYNRAGLLVEAIESVRSQTYADWELIVVDDESGDSTSQVMEEWVRRDARIRYVRQKHAGVAAARNRGISEARGEFLAFLDDDDEFLPEKLAVQSDYLRRHPAAGFVYSQMEVANPGRMVIEPQAEAAVRNLAELFDRCLIRPSGVLCRSGILHQAGEFDASVEPCEDYDLWLKMAALAPFGFIERPLARYGVLPGSASKNFVRQNRKRAILLKRVRVNPVVGVTFWGRRRRLGANEYRLARFYRDNAEHLKSTKCLIRAILDYPLIGLTMAQPKPAGLGLVAAIVKPYLAVWVCAAKAIVCFRRQPIVEKT